MQRVIVIVCASLFVFAGAGPALAKTTIHKKLIPCGPGQPGQLCAVDRDHMGFGSTSNTGSSSSGSNCESSSWGDTQNGGSQTVCADSNGSSTWDTQEWHDGAHFQDSGSVQKLGPKKFRSTTSSSDSDHGAR